MDVGETALKQECPEASKNDIRLLLETFLDRDSDYVKYPELLAFLGCCSLWNVMFRLHMLDRIRQRQGYNFGEYLAKKFSKKEKMVERAKFSALFVSLGFVVPEAAMDTIFGRYGDRNSIDVTEFAKALGEVKGQANNDAVEKAPRRAFKEDRKDGGRDPITEKILDVYHAHLVTVVERAFDLFDVDGSDTVETIEIERILCALGFSPTLDDVLELSTAIDHRNTGEMEFERFREKVIAYCSKQYDTIHAVSEEMLRSAFQRLDLNGDGSISRAECQYALESVAKSLTEKEVQSFFDFLDIDNSGSIDWMEFKVLFALLQDEAALLNLPETTQSGMRKVEYSCPDMFCLVLSV